jgi:hypothetical protein
MAAGVYTTTMENGIPMMILCIVNALFPLMRVRMRIRGFEILLRSLLLKAENVPYLFGRQMEGESIFGRQRAIQVGTMSLFHIDSHTTP